jgi:hypothetical protein
LLGLFVHNLVYSTQSFFKATFLLFFCDIDQGCQISLGTIYKNGENIPNYHKIYQIVLN